MYEVESLNISLEIREYFFKRKMKQSPFVFVKKSIGIFCEYARLGIWKRRGEYNRRNHETKRKNS